MNSLLENIQVDAAIVSNTTSSAIYSQSFSMRGYHRAAAVIQVGTLPATGVAQVQMTIMGGDATTAPSAMSSIAGAYVNIGTSSTSGLVNNAHKIRINCMGSAAATVAAGLTLNFGTSTFLTSATADSTAGHFLTGLASVVAKSLTTLIQTWYPQYNTTYSATGASTISVDVELNNLVPETTGIYAKTTAQSTISGLNVQSLKTQGIVSMSAGKLVATASSFTNFAIRVVSTDSSAIAMAVNVFRDPVYAPKTISAGHTIV